MRHGTAVWVLCAGLAATSPTASIPATPTAAPTAAPAMPVVRATPAAPAAVRATLATLTTPAAARATSVMQSQPAPASHPAFEQIKTLAGQWEGVSDGRPVRTSFRVVANGSAVLNVLEPEGEPEMVTMFHLDGSVLMATHYCSVGNQPRMVARPTNDPTLISFRFKDVTNLAGPEAGHMRGLVLKVADADHHREEWTFRQGRANHTAVFVFTRVK